MRQVRRGNNGQVQNEASKQVPFSKHKLGSAATVEASHLNIAARVIRAVHRSLSDLTLSLSSVIL